MRHLVVEIELTEPPVGKVQPDFLAQTAFVSDTVAVSDDQHPNHEFWIDRRAADLAVKGLWLVMPLGERCGHDHVQPPQQVVLMESRRPA